MDVSLLFKYVVVIFREMWRSKFLCLFGFAVVSYIVLVMGMFWPSKFQSTATIFADNQNILRPLLQNQAEQSNVQNQTRVVRDMIHSPRLLKKVVESEYDLESAGDIGVKVNSLRNRINVQGVGGGYIKVSYSDSTAADTYRIINAVVDEFIKSSSEEQRSESREAFLFIDNQVKQYKDQLVRAEEKLKEFHSFNFDGRDNDVDASIARLRDQIEELRIALDEDDTTIKALKKQLDNESEFSSTSFRADIYSQRLSDLEARLSALLLTYTEDYPDVVSLKYQIEDVKKTIRESEKPQSLEANEESVVLNPLYQELRSRLSVVMTESEAKEKRLAALDQLLQQEYERRKRIAERAAEEAELTRDYNVTMRIYEDMLERKERARLSMTLNVEGQGVTYRVQEPALLPLNPVGFRFFHFVLLGPVLGVLFVVGLTIAYVLIDRRIRFPSALDELGVNVLAVVPHLHTRFSERVKRVDIIICLALSVLIMACYIGLAFASKMGIL